MGNGQPDHFQRLAVQTFAQDREWANLHVWLRSPIVSRRGVSRELIERWEIRRPRCHDLLARGRACLAAARELLAQAVAVEAIPE